MSTRVLAWGSALWRASGAAGRLQWSAIIKPNPQVTSGGKAWDWEVVVQDGEVQVMVKGGAASQEDAQDSATRVVDWATDEASEPTVVAERVGDVLRGFGGPARCPECDHESPGHFFRCKAYPRATP